MPINYDTTKRIPITVSHEMADKISELAKKERRSVASYLRNIIEDHVNSQG